MAEIFGNDRKANAQMGCADFLDDLFALIFDGKVAFEKGEDFGRT